MFCHLDMDYPTDEFSWKIIDKIYDFAPRNSKILKVGKFSSYGYFW